MYKRKLKSTIATAITVLLIGACATKDSNGPSYSSSINLLGSSQSADRTKTTMVFSVDNGATYSDAIVMPVGQKYKVKVWDAAAGYFLTNPYGMTLDWSASKPAPDSPSSDNPTFTMAGSNTIAVTITGTLFCPYDPSVFLGTWKGAEGTNTEVNNGVLVGTFGGSTDTQVFTVDPNNPNKIWATNLWGDGAGASWYMILTPSTSFDTQIVTVPAQTTVEGGDVAASSGIYDVCSGAFGPIPITYCFGTDCYSWTYHYTR